MARFQYYLALATVLVATVGCDRILTVQGTVSDFAGNPVDAATVTVCPDCPIPSDTKTDHSGCFIFGTTASPFDHRDIVSIEKPGFKALTIAIEDAEVADLQVVLARQHQEESGSVHVTHLPLGKENVCNPE